MKRFFRSLLSAVTLLLLCGPAVEAEKTVLGRLEKALMKPGGFVLEAKVDTGADNTSLDARNITVIRRNGKNILRFNVDDRKGKAFTLEREQVGIELVPQHRGDDEERPVIVLEVCIGNECRNTLVNLVDRSKKKYPLLIGRSFMLDRVVVDAGEVLASATADRAKRTAGLVERVRVEPSGLIVDAKLDTGADNSSIHASDIVRFKRRGESWVRFRIVGPKGGSETIERPLVRIARIKRPTGKSQKRPVVMLGICLGTFYKEVQVTLVDRSRFRYRMIIGRSFLGNDFLVDPAAKHVVEPACADK